MVFVFGACSLLAYKRWEAADPQHPGTALVLEVFQTIKNKFHWKSHEGSTGAGLRKKVSDWLHPRKGE